MCAHVHTNTRSTEIYKDFVGHFEWRHPVFNCETQSLITWQIWKKRWLNAFQSAQCCGVKFRGIGMIAGIYCKTVQHYGYVVLVSKGIEPGASSNEVCWGNIILCVASVQKMGILDITHTRTKTESTIISQASISWYPATNLKEWSCHRVLKNICNCLN